MSTVKPTRRLGMLLLCLSGIPALAAAPLSTTEITPGVHVHQGVHEDIDARNQGDIANIGFVIGDQSVAVIDPGGSPAIGEALLEAVRRHTDLPVTHVVLTHFHPDHVLGVGAFPADAEVVAHVNYLRSQAQRASFYRDRYTRMLSLEAGAFRAPDRLVRPDDPITLNLGGRSLLLEAHPVAHSDNDLTVYDATSDTLWAADLVFDTRIPSIDGSVLGWFEVMQQLQASYPGATVIPGHGRPGKLLPRLAAQRDYLEAVVTEVRDGIAANQPLSSAVDSIAVDAAADWELSDLQHTGNVTRAWNELEWE